MTQQADEFTFPTIADHHYPDFTPSFWCFPRKVSDCSFPINSHGGANQGEDFEFKPETHPRKDLSSMGRLSEHYEVAERIDDLQKEFGYYDFARSLPCHSTTVNPYIREDGRKSPLEEEKMDMLWEDFNDDSSGNYEENAGRRSITKIESAVSSDSHNSSPKMGEICCVHALKISKGRPSFMVLLKAWKKLLLIKNSRLSCKH